MLKPPTRDAGDKVADPIYGPVYHPSIGRMINASEPGTECIDCGSEGRPCPTCINAYLDAQVAAAVAGERARCEQELTLLVDEQQALIVAFEELARKLGIQIKFDIYGARIEPEGSIDAVVTAAIDRLIVKMNDAAAAGRAIDHPITPAPPAEQASATMATDGAATEGMRNA